MKESSKEELEKIYQETPREKAVDYENMNDDDLTALADKYSQDYGEGMFDKFGEKPDPIEEPVPEKDEYDPEEVDDFI